MLGEENERGPSIPLEYYIAEPGIKGKVRRGGTAFERSGHAHPVAEGTRTYGIAMSYERTTKLISPAKGNKVSAANEDLRGLRMRRDHGVSVGVAASRYLPEEFRTHMRLQAELVNAPSIGTSGNVFWSNAQVNLSHADHGYTGINDLSRELGIFGDGHKDGEDALAGLTCMISHPDMPNNYFPGFFFLFELGIFVSLSNFKMMFFSGLRKHGGSAPQAPPGMKAVDWAYRFVLILYPLSSIMSNTGITAIATLQSKHLIRTEAKQLKWKPLTEEEEKEKKESQGLLGISPEMKNNPQDINSRPWSVHTTWASDGHIIMPGDALLNFITRMLLLLCTFVLAQVHHKFQIRIDTDVFLSAFSMGNPEFKGDATTEDAPSRSSAVAPRITARTWLYAPHLNDPSKDVHRERAARHFKEFERRSGQLIPQSVLAKGKTFAMQTSMPIIHWAKGGRPALEAQRKKPDLDNEDSLRVDPKPVPIKPKKNDKEKRMKSSGGRLSHILKMKSRVTEPRKRMIVEIRSTRPPLVTSQILRRAHHKEGEEEEEEEEEEEVLTSPVLRRSARRPTSGHGALHSEDEDVDMDAHHTDSDELSELTAKLNYTPVDKQPVSIAYEATFDSDDSPELNSPGDKTAALDSPPVEQTPRPDSLESENLEVPARTRVQGDAFFTTQPESLALLSLIIQRQPQAIAYDAKSIVKEVADFISSCDDSEGVSFEDNTISEERAVSAAVTPLTGVAEDDSLAGLCQAWHSLGSLKAQKNKNNILTIYHRFHMMKNHADLWAWLELIAARHSNPECTDRDTHPGIQKLAARLLGCLQAQIKETSILSSAYLPTIPKKSTLFKSIDVVYAEMDLPLPHRLQYTSS
ncbi:hypothetical protein OF83DRAFT_1174049 [Amylostereum chailletii]|nr:hypothetical protein OF83DRAFT_1174049 [Amylostereum chailletii]